ncbi:MAG TPA: hypothetical protein VKA50_12460 [Gammaproteobacteria bacterium]|nr:hypothetical protein [Gammaproteobacteria bacterium]
MMDQHTPSVVPGWGWSTGAGAARKNLRQIFVSYGRALHPKAEFRRIFDDLAKAFTVEFVFPDEASLSAGFPQRVATALRSARFGIFDVSGWDPNVLLELGLAFGLSERTCVVARTDSVDQEPTPADLRGLGRIHYRSYEELQDYLFRLLSDELPVPRSHEVEHQVEGLREDALLLIREHPGLRIGDIANLLGVSIDMAKLIVKPMVGCRVRLEGAARGARYYPLNVLS